MEGTCTTDSPNDGQHPLESSGVNEIWLTQGKSNGVIPAMVVVRHEVDKEDRKVLEKIHLRRAATLMRRDGGGKVCWVLSPRRGFLVRSRWTKPDGETAHESFRVGEVKIVPSESTLTFNGSYPVVFDPSVPVLREPRGQARTEVEGEGAHISSRVSKGSRGRQRTAGNNHCATKVQNRGNRAKAGSPSSPVGGGTKGSPSTLQRGRRKPSSATSGHEFMAVDGGDGSVAAAKEGVPGYLSDGAWGFESEPEWSCPQCTLVNTGSYLQCDACGFLQPTERPLRPAVFPPKSYMEDQAKQWSTTSEINRVNKSQRARSARGTGMGTVASPEIGERSERGDHARGDEGEREFDNASVVPPSPSGPSAGGGKRKRTPGNAAQLAFDASAVRPSSPRVRVPAACAVSSMSSGGASSCGVPGVKTAVQKGQRGAADSGRDAVVPLSRATPAGAMRMLAIGKQSGTQRTAVATPENQTPLRASKLPARKSPKIESAAVEKRRRSTSAATTAALRRSDSPRRDRELGRGGAALPRSRATLSGAGSTNFDIRPAATETISAAPESQIPAWFLNHPVLSSLIKAEKSPACSEGMTEGRRAKEASVETAAEQRRSRVTSGGVKQRRAKLDDAIDAPFLPQDTSLEQGMSVYAANKTVGIETELVDGLEGEIFNAPFMNTWRVFEPLASSPRPDSPDTTLAPTIGGVGDSQGSENDEDGIIDAEAGDDDIAETGDDANAEAGDDANAEVGGEAGDEANSDGGDETESDPIERVELHSEVDTDAEFQLNDEVEHDDCWNDDDCRSTTSRDY